LSAAPDRSRDLGAADLVAGARAELAAVEPTRACCRAAERAGLGAAALGQARSPAVARLAVRLPASPSTPAFEWASSRDHCRVAYLRGVFLATGSLSLAGGRVHLEFVVPVDDAPRLSAQLGELGLPAAWRVRRGRGVVTWKSTERVIAFLRMAGARRSALEIESRAVTRTLRSDLNRALNAEGANLVRTVRNSSRQVEDIDQLERSGRLAALPAPVQALAQARRELPEATYTELAERLGVSRGTVQRGFERLAASASASAGHMAPEPERAAMR
jgi:DNA-binding transcriptional regulator WhiA